MVSVNHNNLRVLFFPFMAQGHMLPMVDIAKLFAARGVDTTIFTTPINASLIQPSIDSANGSGRNPIRLYIVPFPSCPGLPEGIENVSAVTSIEMRVKFVTAVSKLRDPFDQVLTELAPDCVVTDIFLPWTVDVATEHSIPRFLFHGSNFFAQCVSHSLDKYKPLENLPAEAESFVVPGLPNEIKLLKSQIDLSAHADPMRAEFLDTIKESYSKSYGEIVNSFYELEPEYVQHYRNVIGRKAWHVGPVSLCNENVVGKYGRGSKASVDNETCMNWLETRSPGSVVYVCFGSMADLSEAHVRELALGLEASNHPFIWVMKKENKEITMAEGFEERTKERGLIIKGWAPQILILNHSSVGCFVTHCGWNSSLEAISAGVPLVTWPMFAEQFYNERLIVDVLKIGIAVGIKYNRKEPEEREVVRAVTIENCVGQVMGGGEKAEEMRRRVKELREMAKKAVEEGGSSYVEMGNLIQELTDRRRGD